MPLRSDASVESLNRRTGNNLPGWFGVNVVAVSEGRLAMEVVIKPEFLAPNGYLHAASIIGVADTAAGYATIAHLPDGATNFTTIELKANFLGTATEGTL
ncbi:MAG TPA: PaaI family thioesterase, partial [Burkholderiaceae bacterium]|nr:PaaI family thioesterase [Burkholderiaceae bacterium]